MTHLTVVPIILPTLPPPPPLLVNVANWAADSCPPPPTTPPLPPSVLFLLRFLLLLNLLEYGMQMTNNSDSFTYFIYYFNGLSTGIKTIVPRRRHKRTISPIYLSQCLCGNNPSNKVIYRISSGHPSIRVLTGVAELGVVLLLLLLCWQLGT